MFEAMEASPLSEKVLESGNALHWAFPGSAVAVPFEVYDDAKFLKAMAQFLERASTESIKDYAAQTQKAGSRAFESRDTAHPDIISQLFMTLLEANGRRLFPPLLAKKVRDEAAWGHGAERPWRRSPMWLILRVGLQRHLYALLGHQTGRLHYKFFMSLFLMRLLQDSTHKLEVERVHFLKAKVCRRLAKLEAFSTSLDETLSLTHQDFLQRLSPSFQIILRNASSFIDSVWTDVKIASQRKITMLPTHALPADLRLSLSNSRAFLT